MRGAGLDPSHLIGGEVPELGGNGHGGKGQGFVVEACEFNRSFHNLRPFGAAILNLDHDHFDCYPSTDELIEAFAGYLARIRPGGTALVEESVPKAVLSSLRSDVEILTVGSGLWADLRALDVCERLGCWSFVPVLNEERLPRVELSMAGRHNMFNAMFALGLAHVAGADLAGACAGISEFVGVRRRFELHEGAGGGVLVNDYAHHPVEIEAVLQTARRRFPDRRLVVAFQPHQYQRTLLLMESFAASLAAADVTLIAEIYGARESDEIMASVSAGDLVAAVRERGERRCIGELEPRGEQREDDHRDSDEGRSDRCVAPLRGNAAGRQPERSEDGHRAYERQHVAFEGLHKRERQHADQHPSEQPARGGARLKATTQRRPARGHDRDGPRHHQP